MLHHELKIGQRIYDLHDDKWGTILLIDGQDKSMVVTEDVCDHLLTYKPDDSDGESETYIDSAYPIVPNETYKGEPICLEINADDFDVEHHYPYYCPEFNENLWGCEIDKNK